MTCPAQHPLNPDQLIAAEAFDDGFHAGWTAATPSYQQRDERIARRIVALLLQHDANGQLVDSVLRTQPYSQRGIPRRVTG